MAKLHLKTFSHICRVMFKRKYYLYGEVTSADFQFLYRTKVEFYPGEQEYIDVAVFGTNKHSKIAGKKHPGTVITTDDKTDTWLKLYFGDNLRLIEEQFTGYDSYKYIK